MMLRSSRAHCHEAGSGARQAAGLGRAEVQRPMSIAVVAGTDPGLVLGRAGDLLAGDPVGHNVAGTKLADAIRYGEPGRYWIALRDGVPAGLAVQQPADTPLAVAPMAAELAVAIARTADADGVALPGVFGPAGTASRFAGEWAERRRVAAMPTSAERLYEIRDLRFPADVDGALRRAAEAERELLLSWLPGFEAGAAWAGSNPAAVFVTRRLAAGEVWIWDDQGPVSMAARTETVCGVSRIQAVNTPPGQRARGYASASVAALSADLLAQGLRCVLNASLSNVTASSVYRRLGYQAVSEVLRYRFG
jgi:ribosomal protein S18 acetylase RimI-like enzyme